MDAARKTILAIDDDESIRGLLSSLLTEEGYEVLLAEHGGAGLSVLGTRNVDLILLDMRMPVLDGWGFAEAYRSLPGPHAPVIVITAATDAGRNAAQVAAHSYVPKPFDLDDMISAIESALRS